MPDGDPGDETATLLLLQPGLKHGRPEQLEGRRLFRRHPSVPWLQTCAETGITRARNNYHNLYSLHVSFLLQT